MDANNCVIFDKHMATGEDISFITTQKAKGDSMRMRRERNVWVLDAFTDKEDDCDNVNRDLVFARHESALNGVR